ncbi:MAG TPA: hypothetical protein VHP58_04705 [Alphaproteobacteria bacterium]|nr:hypothetical protein [Alphaproteobacteria bacterium]
MNTIITPTVPVALEVRLRVSSIDDRLREAGKRPDTLAPNCALLLQEAIARFPVALGNFSPCLIEQVIRPAGKVAQATVWPWRGTVACLPGGLSLLDVYTMASDALHPIVNFINPLQLCLTDSPEPLYCLNLDAKAVMLPGAEPGALKNATFMARMREHFDHSTGWERATNPGTLPQAECLLPLKPEPPRSGTVVQLR